MRIIKLLLISILLLFGVITVISFFFPSQIRISKAVDIESTTDQVFHQLSTPSLWPVWYPGMRDSAVTLRLLPDGKGVDINSSTVRITERRMDTVLTEISSGSGKTIQSTWAVIAHENGIVTVQWFMDFKFRWYPWEKFSSLFYENLYGVRMEEGLSSLKSLLESDRLSYK